MVNELKPCPFCGGTAAIHWRAGNAFASCEDLGCVGSDFSVDPTAWNTRAGRPSELEAEVARLREALEKIAANTAIDGSGTWSGSAQTIARAAMEAER